MCSGHLATRKEWDELSDVGRDTLWKGPTGPRGFTQPGRAKGTGPGQWLRDIRMEKWSTQVLWSYVRVQCGSLPQRPPLLYPFPTHTPKVILSRVEAATQPSQTRTCLSSSLCST